jgi:hypothetical protein
MKTFLCKIVAEFRFVSRIGQSGIIFVPLTEQYGYKELR